mmetsp:Transcript_10678/g.19499  ORF Transcript_10678/g.19499 Transcript_10678/m.19499 type:complete len:385 (-) Transcript_10678:328-1482(-)|eukprot:CAMPEP_0175053648 /NCGR_PEP_ID=MMETSP0052_2-20121109/9050_1 /TAXON_ID=51329 ORGANISM="Polytomella parva, Strain SAG 63-3" /NCGR_SAMPLE_ID=MMETSP0052_2 /ASSEMBLY_ACC=CAM_ASM_000194 /LENGTH=384 /DNA_ID=CAMNT_0016318223 /DNA_START=173 /DNA_END=1327 /DNA_ORIENTATION=+
MATKTVSAEENELASNNNPKVALPGKAGLLNNQGSKRRALGDIGNVIVNNRAAVPVGKEKDASKDAQNTSLVPRTRAQIAAAAASKQTGASTTCVLQQRSASAVPSSPSLPDIDSMDKYNPLMASEYVHDIYSYYKRVEPKFRVPEDYMRRQIDINEKMRAILVDWLVEVHLKFKLMPETLFLTVNLIDRFLNEKQVTRKNLQLVGVTAMLIASKYEEIWAPEVQDYVFISDRAYSKEQILGMEKLMLNTLKFQLTLPTTYNFLARNLKAANFHFDKDVTMMSSYLVELALVDYSMLKYSCSAIAAAALFVAANAYNRPKTFPVALAKHSGYSKEDVLPVAHSLIDLLKNATTNNLSAVHKKYSSVKFNEAALVECSNLANTLS